MTDEILNSDNSNEQQVVIVGNNTHVSMKVIQNIYNEITGRTEKLTKSFRENHQIKFEDIKQLNIKINQLYEQYNIVNKNCSVVVYYIDDTKEQFSSFDRFQLYDSSKTSPCINIKLEYNFLIVLPNTNRMQPYQIEINLGSKSAMSMKAHSEHGIEERILRIISIKSGEVEIEYVDYTVARNFIGAINQWYEGLDKGILPKIIDYAQKYSNHCPFLFKLATILFIITHVIYNKNIFITKTPTLQTLFSGSVLALGISYIFIIISSKLGSWFEYSIDSYQSISWIKLNRGDEKAIQQLYSKNSKSYLKMSAALIFSILINLFINLASSLLAKALGISI